MGFLQGFVGADGGGPVAGFAEGAGFGAAGFEVGGVEGEGAVAVEEGGGVVFELGWGEGGLVFWRRILTWVLGGLGGHGIGRERERGGAAYIDTGHGPILQDLRVCAFVAWIHGQRFRVDLHGFRESLPLERCVSFALHPVQFLHHPKILDSFFEVWIAVQGLTEMLKRFVVVALAVECPASENQGFRVLSVPPEQVHGYVLGLSKRVDVTHLQVSLPPQKDPFPGTLRTDPQTALGLVQSMDRHAACCAFSDNVFGLLDVVFHGLGRRAVSGLDFTTSCSNSVEGVESFGGLAYRGVDAGEAVQDFDVGWIRREGCL